MKIPKTYTVIIIIIFARNSILDAGPPEYRSVMVRQKASVVHLYQGAVGGQAGERNGRPILVYEHQAR